MIVQESDSLLAALDRRLQVDRIASLEPLQAPGGPTDRGVPPRAAPLAPSVAPSSEPSTGPSTTATRLVDRLPLGEVVSARVVAAPRPDQVVAEIGELRIAMAWPSGSGPAPRPGSDIGLRVLALRPMLLFQNVAGRMPLDEAARLATDPSPIRWSSDALRLQVTGGTPLAGGRAGGPMRFEAPMLQIETEFRTTMRRSTVGAPSPPPTPRPPDEPAGPATQRTELLAEAHTHIALDDVIVAREAAHVDGVATPLVPRAAPEGDRGVVPFAPVVLQGPAWPGQPLELVVRRERADEQFDNAALDHWCGELSIDLPLLGRIAGHLTWSMQGLRIRMEGDGDDTIAAMNEGSVELATAFASADLRIAALSVGGPSADYRRPDDGATAAPVVTFARQARG